MVAVPPSFYAQRGHKFVNWSSLSSTQGQNNFQMLDYLVTSMDEFTRAHPYTGILLLGNFNQLPDSQLKSFPLQQIVTCPTRGNCILDKIYTNVTDWYQTPIILPGVSRSDHEAIHLKPAADPPRPSRSIRVFLSKTCFS